MAIPLQPSHPAQVFEINAAYQQLLDTDPHFAAIHERGLRRLPISNADFLFLQEQVSQDPKNLQSPAFLLIWNILGGLLQQIRWDFHIFYGLDQTEVDMTVIQMLLWSVVHASPNILAASETLGLDWGSHLIEMVRQGLWAALIGGYRNTSRLSDADFRTFFEQRWPELMLFRGAKFDFRVVPTLAPEDFVRYQKLPYGDKTIRGIISSYIVHQATTYPHLSELVAQGLVSDAYHKRVKDMYTPLVKLAIKQVLARPGVTKADAKRIEADVTQQAWDAYAEAVKNFRFHMPYSGKPSPLGLLGILGLAESQAERDSFDTFLREGGDELLGLALPEGEKQVQSNDLTPIVFAHYINERLQSWRRETYPPPAREVPMESLDQPAYSGDGDGPTLGETLASTGGWAVDPNVLSHEEPAVVGFDGMPYLTIEQVARQQDASLKQLRYLEKAKLYTPKRAGEILGASPPFGKTIRLYPNTPEARTEIKMALIRTATRSSSLQGQEVSRKVAGAVLSVSISQLRSWERAGKLTPVKRGRSVIYGPDCLKAARRLIQGG